MLRTGFIDAAVGMGAAPPLEWRRRYAAISKRVNRSWMTVPFGYRLLGTVGPLWLVSRAISHVVAHSATPC